VGTPLGDFVRAKRDGLRPEDLGLPPYERRRVPGLRRSDLAARAGISVEYLTRIEQGRDRRPSPAVVNALADALGLDVDERTHLYYLAKLTSGGCAGHDQLAPAPRTVRPAVLETLRLLEPGVALLTNRLGDVLAYTSGFELIVRGTGLLDTDAPNLTRYVFTDPRARSVFLDWDQVADELVFDLSLGAADASASWFRTELAPIAGPEFTRRLDRHVPPPRVPLRINQAGHELRWQRETLELPSSDAQQLVVFLPADESTAEALQQLRREHGGPLRVA
jgi:transcriptional regulator with XRE-family HTH domain